MSENHAFKLGSIMAILALLLVGKCAWDWWPHTEPMPEVHALGASVNPPAAFVPPEGVKP